MSKALQENPRWSLLQQNAAIASLFDKLPSLKAPKPPKLFDSQWLDLKYGKVRYVHLSNFSSTQTVILMPDPPNTIEHMEPLIRLLHQNFEVIAFEGPGFGYSRAKRSYHFSISQGAETIIELLEKLKVENALLALTCVGALSGLRAANQRPDLITRLVLAQVPSLEEAQRWAQRVDFKGMLGTPYLGQFLLRLARNRITELWYRNALPKQTDSKPYASVAKSSFQNGARFSLASAFQALQHDHLSQEDLIAPQKAIIFWGTQDRTHKKTDRQSILKLTPNGSIIEIDQCGHFPDLEAPEFFAQAISDLTPSNELYLT